MNIITEKLFEIRDEEYAKFQASLVPGISEESIIGVRIPVLRQFAKEHFNDDCIGDFMSELPHAYYDENLLHGVFISMIKDYDNCMYELERFLPYIDNWAVCDTLSPKVFSKHKAELMEKIREWICSKEVYTSRFAMRMLMSHFLDADFKEKYLQMPASVHSSEYYVNMMIAWFFATALAKQWDASIPYIENNCLDIWVHNKTIQKSVESFRVTEEHKNYLRKLRRK